MKIALKHQAKEKANSPTCSVTEYELKDDMLDMAIATIAGRYPEQNRIVNQQCDELAYVFEGEGKIVVNHHEYRLSAGDVLIIEAGDKYFWEGKMKLFLSCRPAWKEEQHCMVE